MLNINEMIGKTLKIEGHKNNAVGKITAVRIINGEVYINTTRRKKSYDAPIEAIVIEEKKVRMKKIVWNLNGTYEIVG